MRANNGKDIETSDKRTTIQKNAYVNISIVLHDHYKIFAGWERDEVQKAVVSCATMHAIHLIKISFFSEYKRYSHYIYNYPTYLIYHSCLLKYYLDINQTPASAKYLSKL